ncbi:hypothetical protein AC481_03550 [miscellaneous Crenarchaeota group archaeon SMTZ-80]|nr:MAG: hypothetical protein AC481_03550 [miscellaneous Crenarchaeota group archaeon SMTZ-80]
MFKINIRDKALNQLSNYINKTHEQIGLLIGKFENGELYINEVINGTGEADKSHCMFSQDLLAEVADNIINGRLEGSIVGWCHSHIHGGIFMSSIDIETQCKLQQFSQYIVSIVVDVSSRQFGIFIYDQQSGPIQIPSEYISIS